LLEQGRQLGAAQAVGITGLAIAAAIGLGIPLQQHQVQGQVEADRGLLIAHLLEAEAGGIDGGLHRRGGRHRQVEVGLELTGIGLTIGGGDEAAGALHHGAQLIHGGLHLQGAVVHGGRAEAQGWFQPQAHQHNRLNLPLLQVRAAAAAEIGVLGRAAGTEQGGQATGRPIEGNPAGQTFSRGSEMGGHGPQNAGLQPKPAATIATEGLSGNQLK
jgi:hypothetical protein